MAETKSEKPLDPLAKLKHDVEFWKQHYEKAEQQVQSMGAELVKQGSELLDLKDKLEAAKNAVRYFIEERDEMRKHLVTVLDHTAGKTGALTLSHEFCGVCENPMMCPHKKARRYLAENARFQPAEGLAGGVAS